MKLAVIEFTDSEAKYSISRVSVNLNVIDTSTSYQRRNH